MKRKIKHIYITGIFLIFCFVFVPTGFAADTCMFTTTADDIPPLIVLLLDNGAEMEQIVWHSGYDNSVDYTPNPATVTSVFTNSNGYAIKKSGITYYLYPIQSDLTLDTASGTAADSSGDNPTWTLTVNPGEAKTKTIALPGDPSTAVDGDGIKDNATVFRYFTNYLNWIYYSIGDGSYDQVSADDDGTDLPAKSRFYYAKKAIFNVARLTANKTEFGIYNFTSNSNGASRVQPLGLVVNTPLAANPANNTLGSSFINNINNMGTVTYSPLAEGLASVGGYYASASSGVVGEYCQNLFSVVITPGVSSEDLAIGSSSEPTVFADYDGDGEGGTVTVSGITYTVLLNQNGSTYLDDVAHYLYTHDIPGYSGADGKQIVATYTIGFMGNAASNAYLKNTSNIGNGITDVNDPEYGNFHFEAEDPDALSDQLMDAISNIISKTSTFTAPVVPVTRTTSGNHIYMAFFKPLKSGNFWEGNVTKFGIEKDANGDIQIYDKNGARATWPNGAIKEETEPYWTTRDWADPLKSNYILNSSRLIYAGNTTTLFTVGNMTAAMLGSPTSITVNATTVTGVEKVVNYIRGADVLDEDNDGNTTENRSVITGDILHSEPVVIEYDNAHSTDTFVFYGSNDGMLHAVRDSNGTEEWAFIPSDLLSRLKDILEGSDHQYYVDSSPKVYTPDGNGDGVVNAGETAILICGERRGGSYYFALDITNPSSPTYLWNMGGGALGETWSEPQFGVVNNGGSNENVFIVGGGYSSTNASGVAVIVAMLDTGNIIAQWDNSTSGMNYSIPSSVKVVDENNNGIIDKIYVGDLGGQMWRIGRFTEADGVTPLTFPNSNEDITTWEAEILFDATNVRKIYYPPAVTMEKGFDMVFFGTGDRDDACNQTTSDRIYAVKDVHASWPLAITLPLTEGDLVDVTDPNAALPNLPSDNGFFLTLNLGEKILAEPIVFYKVLYMTTYTPHDPSSPTYDPCMPGGVGTLYALQYLTGGAAIDFTGDTVADRSRTIGGGIPSKPVMVIPPGGLEPRLFISVGSTEADPADTISEEFGAGTLVISPDLPSSNFFYLWWNEL